MMFYFKFLSFLLALNLVASSSIFPYDRDDVIMHLNRQFFKSLSFNYPFRMLNDQAPAESQTESKLLMTTTTTTEEPTTTTTSLPVMTTTEVVKVEVNANSTVSSGLIEANTTAAPLLHSVEYWNNSNGTFFLRTVVKLVSLRVSNSSHFNVSKVNKALPYLASLIQHSVLKSMFPKVDSACVKMEVREKNLKNESFEYIKSDDQKLNISHFPICVNLTLASPVRITIEEFEKAVMSLAVNKEECAFCKNETTIKCFADKPISKYSLIRLGDFWFQLHKRSEAVKAVVLKQQNDEEVIFKYSETWVISLAVISGVIALFFLGCIVAICYTRRPYRRSGKVYEVESARKKSAKAVPQIPSVHPTTKASAVTKNKELYY